MTAIQQFIEDAISGGWNEREWFEKETQISHALFLETSVWQAVGKTRGWDEGEAREELVEPEKPPYEFAPSMQWMWQFKWHRFVDALCDGKNIEEALSIISE